MGQNEISAMVDTKLHDGDPHAVEFVKNHTQKLQDDLQKLGLKIKHHEDNLKFLKSQLNNIGESILDMEGNLGNYHSSSEAVEQSNSITLVRSEEHTIETILQQEKTAAGIICQMKVYHGLQASKLPLMKDVLGIVATLAMIDDDNLSRLLSEYLGLEMMLAIVCKTYEGVKALEKYDKVGMIEKSGGLHGLGPSIGRHLDGRFFVLCLENLRPYVGEFVADDPQKKLLLLNPRLPSGDSPPGFIGFAVNMIKLDHMHLSCVTASGHGLRETLFYALFSRLQVYRTRSDMERALPCISDGAISLDGGIMKSGGLFYLGDRKDIEVKFPISSGKPSIPANIIEIKEHIKFMNWKKERLVEDMQREEAVLKSVKNLFRIRKQEFLKYLSETASYAAQTQPNCSGTETLHLEFLPDMT